MQNKLPGRFLRAINREASANYEGKIPLAYQLITDPMNKC